MTGESQIFVFWDETVLDLPDGIFRLEEYLNICVLSQVHRQQMTGTRSAMRALLALAGSQSPEQSSSQCLRCWNHCSHRL